MKTVFVLFDSLNRTALGAYGGTAIATPNFDRFAQQSLVFDKHYVGSLPCMPARRDMHTGRLSFTHRPWGPLEPFDNSYAKILSQNGVYSHIISDHLHYFEDGGWGYTAAFDSWEFIRGQEYDSEKVMVRPPVSRIREKFDERQYPLNGLSESKTATRHTTDEATWRRSRHAINALFTKDEKDFPTAKCFAAAFEFLDVNHQADDWFLQLECFDPHEPFSAPERFRQAYSQGYQGKVLDWPFYAKASESEQEIAEIRGNYAALVAMCDAYFGRLLDWFDANDAWADTTLILTTDHGFLLAEHEWWGKCRMPCYEDVAHVPLMIRSPGMTTVGERFDGMTQTTDLMPTFLQLHDIAPPREATSHSLTPALAGGSTERESAISGVFGGPICVCDGRYSYHHFPIDPHKHELPLFTLMPAHMEMPFRVEELRTVELAPPFDFTKGVPTMRIDVDRDHLQMGFDLSEGWDRGSMLFDLDKDPEQAHPIDDHAAKARLKAEIVRHLEEHSAPAEMFAYYGLERTTSENIEINRAEVSGHGVAPRA